MHKIDPNGALTDLMTHEEMKVYTYERKFHTDPEIRKTQLENLNIFKIHNAFRTEEVEELFDDASISYIKYKPSKSQEYHFYIPSTGNLHVVNTRGDIRLLRDQDQYRVLKEIAGYNSLKRNEKHYKNSQARASIRFTEFAFNLVNELYPYIDAKAIDEQGQINVILGPKESLDTNDITIEKESQNDFLDYRILRIDDKPVINFDYVFADQAKNILDNFSIITRANFPDADINIFHYGKIGLLNIDLQVGDICIPTGALIEKKVVENNAAVHPIYNLLDIDKNIAGLLEEIVGEKVHRGLTVDTVSVLRQQRKNLLACLDAGGNFLDMEWKSMSTNVYMNYIFAGVGSDKPLEGKSLANTKYPRLKEKKITQAFKEIIRII